MPIYAYKCGSCGHARDVLQKISDAPLTQCPACGAPAFSKQVTAAGFQLKGSGWYATDFRNGSKNAPATGEDGKSADGAKPADAAKPADGAKTGEAAKPADAGAKSSESSTPAAKPDAPAAAAGPGRSAPASH
jgi:putative FmdB family regulatory protein